MTEPGGREGRGNDESRIKRTSKATPVRSIKSGRSRLQCVSQLEAFEFSLDALSPRKKSGMQAVSEIESILIAL
jgi:hypothetical protein